MSRVGKQPIQLNNARVSVQEKASRYAGQLVSIEGTKGKLEVHVRPEVSVSVNEEGVQLSPKKQTPDKQTNAFQGLYRTLIANAVAGVNTGFSKELEIVGIGYKAEKVGNDVKLNIGFNNLIIYKVPEGINIDIKDGVILTITGIDKQLVGEVAARIRRLKQPEPYKGKGIRYMGEYVKIKAGKTAAA